MVAVGFSVAIVSTCLVFRVAENCSVSLPLYMSGLIKRISFNFWITSD